ncbi:hypothetical protein GQ457_01G052780 [Hibiscus cannabinus]
MAELWAIHDALSHAWSLGFRCMELETNNLEASRIMTGVSGALVDNSLVIVIRNLLSFNWGVKVRHIGRSANGVADSLARLYRGTPIGIVTFAEPPTDAVAAILRDYHSL